MGKIIDWILKTLFKNLKVKKTVLINHIDIIDADADGYIDCLEIVDYLHQIGKELR